MLQSRLPWPVDGHVHFHDLARVAPTLDAAAMNFRTVGQGAGGLLGALLLAQTVHERVFEALAAGAPVPGWALTPAADEPETLIARQDQTVIAVVCGRQVRTKDGLEALALGTRATLEDGLPLADSVAMIRAVGALVVLPWGFGKWLGTRGARVADLLLRQGAVDVFVGDNGGRPAAMGIPALVRSSAQRGIRVISGTDPLPIPGDHQRVGAFGFLAAVAAPEAAPWRALRDWLVAGQSDPVPFGRACGALRFVSNQVGLRLRRRTAASPSI